MVPDKPAPVKTEIIGTNVKFSWLEPNNNGAPITSYNLLILANDNMTLVDDGVYCSSGTGLFCAIPMSDLTMILPNGKFFLQLGDFIQAKVRAVNSLGSG